MRRILVVLICFVTAPALSLDWAAYQNARFGYAIDIPPGFSESAPPPTNGDGQIFAHDDWAAELRVWGANVLEGFPIEFNAMVERAAAEGWEVSIPAGFAADAAFEGEKSGRRVVVHAINYCGGALMAAFQLTYPLDKEAEMIPLISRLSRSLELAPGFMCP